MADVRALLRQQREARRIEHPHAAYSDAGKLLCVVCHEHIKTESLWDSHLRGYGHTQRLQVLQQTATAGSGRTNGHPGGDGGDARASNGGPSNKRKLDDDEVMADDTAEEEAVRKKRSKPNMSLGDQTTKEDTKTITPTDNSKPLTPPLTRRQSGAPALGVEMRIPSRPATPVALREGGASANGAATTPKSAPMGRSPLIPQDPTVGQLPPLSGTRTQVPPDASTEASGAQIDDVWAAFEADLVHGTSGSSSTKPPAIAGFTDSDAVISAPAMSAAEIAAKSEEEEQTKRRALADIQIEDEREEATRALEAEFDVMEELEARARKLRERREALRLQHSSAEGAPSAIKAATVGDEKAVALGKENAVIGPAMGDEDEDDDEIEDDWDGFRFRA